MALGRPPLWSWPDLLLERAKVAVVPGEAFGASGGLRLSFALGDDDLGEGVGRMVELLGLMPTVRSN